MVDLRKHRADNDISSSMKIPLTGWEILLYKIQGIFALKTCSGRPILAQRPTGCSDQFSSPVTRVEHSCRNARKYRGK